MVVTRFTDKTGAIGVVAEVGAATVVGCFAVVVIKWFKFKSSQNWFNLSLSLSKRLNWLEKVKKQLDNNNNYNNNTNIILTFVVDD